MLQCSKQKFGIPTGKGEISLKWIPGGCVIKQEYNKDGSHGLQPLWGLSHDLLPLVGVWNSGYMSRPTLAVTEGDINSSEHCSSDLVQSSRCSGFRSSLLQLTGSYQSYSDTDLDTATLARSHLGKDVRSNLSPIVVCNHNLVGWSLARGSSVALIQYYLLVLIRVTSLSSAETFWNFFRTSQTSLLGTRTLLPILVVVCFHCWC